MSPIHPPTFPAIEGFGELSITAPQVQLHPGSSSGSAGVWAIAATTSETTALKAAGPRRTAAVVAYGGTDVSAIAAEIDPGNQTGSVANFYAQGAQTGLSAQTGNGTAVLGLSGEGGIGIMGKSVGGWAAQFYGDVSSNNGRFVVNGPLTAETTTILGDLSVSGSLTVNTVPISDQSQQIATLQKQMQTLQGVQGALADLQAQLADLQTRVANLEGAIATKS